MGKGRERLDASSHRVRPITSSAIIDRRAGEKPISEENELVIECPDLES